MKPIRLWPWCLALMLSALFFAGSIALLVINPPPMTGYVSSKNHHPKYFPATHSTPEVYTIGITDVHGQRSVTWIVDEQVWGLYEVGDEVGYLPRTEKEGI